MTVELKSVATIDGVEYEAELGTVRGTHIGFEDHGIFSWNIDFDFGGSHQGTGHRTLDAEYGLEAVQSVIGISGKGTWEGLKGAQLLALRRERRGFIVGILNPQTQRYVLFS